MNPIVLVLISICLLANLSSAFFLGNFLRERESNEALWEDRPKQVNYGRQTSSSPSRTTTKPSRTKVENLIDNLNRESSALSKKKYYSNQAHSGNKNETSRLGSYDTNLINVQMSFPETLRNIYETNEEETTDKYYSIEDLMNNGEFKRRQSFGSESFAVTMDRVRPENPKATGGTIRRLNGHSMHALQGMSSSLKYLKPCSIVLPHYHPRGSELIHVINNLNFKFKSDIYFLIKLFKGNRG